LPDDDDDIVSPNLLDMPNGVLPEIIPLTSEQDEITRVTNEVQALVHAGVPREHILIIHASYIGCDRLQERLNKALGPDATIDPKYAPRGEHIRVCTLNAATGLESPIVFLVGMHELYEEEQSIRLSEDERLELIRDNTRKLYMAITRAGRRLVITYRGDIPEMFHTASAPVASK
jgi:superfamily I DNA and RNA helicase